MRGGERERERERESALMQWNHMLHGKPRANVVAVIIITPS